MVLRWYWLSPDNADTLGTGVKQVEAVSYESDKLKMLGSFSHIQPQQEFSHISCGY